MDEIKHELERIIVEINNLEAHLKRETYPINSIKEHLVDIKNRVNNVNDRIKNNPAHEEISKKLLDYSDKITLVLNSGEVFKLREKAIIVMKWIYDSMLVIKSEKSEDREIYFLIKTWEEYLTLLSFVKFNIFSRNEFLEKEFLEYAETNKKLFFDAPKNDDAKIYYSYCLITTVRKLSLTKSENHGIPMLFEIENIIKDMNADLFGRIKKVLDVNKIDYEKELKKMDMSSKELKIVLRGFNIPKNYSKGLISVLISIELNKFK